MENINEEQCQHSQEERPLAIASCKVVSKFPAVSVSGEALSGREAGLAPREARLSSHCQRQEEH